MLPLVLFSFNPLLKTLAGPTPFFLPLKATFQLPYKSGPWFTTPPSSYTFPQSLPAGFIPHPRRLLTRPLSSGPNTECLNQRKLPAKPTTFSLLGRLCRSRPLESHKDAFSPCAPIKHHVRSPAAILYLYFNLKDLVSYYKTDASFTLPSPPNFLLLSLYGQL